MSGYPNPDYGPLDGYPSTVGESCDNPKPAWFWEGGTFCTDVNINRNLIVYGITTTDRLIVNGVEYTQHVFLNNADGKYYNVLASGPVARPFIR